MKKIIHKFENNFKKNDNQMIKYSAKYFGKTAKIIKKHNPENNVLIQFFQRKDNAILCGINEVIELLKRETHISKYKIRYLEEGSTINNLDVVLELEGPYQYFGEYEGIIDGILSRATSLATNAREIIKVANNKKLIFMGDRADHYLNQERDGYAIAIGGIKTQVTDAQISLHEGKAVGTVPHVLIQMFKGDIVNALKAYSDTFPQEDLVALVDYNNDVINDSIKALKAFPNKLVAVRVDTSTSISDNFFANDEEYGVTPNLIKNLRKALDEINGKHIKIIVSSGFNKDKIKDFEQVNTPVDIYGIGQSLLKINNNFTADAVKIDGQLEAKFGRKYRDSKKLISL